MGQYKLTSKTVGVHGGQKFDGGWGVDHKMETDVRDRGLKRFGDLHVEGSGRG